MEFEKFTSLRNTSNKFLLAKLNLFNMTGQPYIVTEKLHGANLSIWVDASEDARTISYARRESFLQDGEKFYNYRNVVAQLKAAVDRLIDGIVKDFGKCKVKLICELYGGSVVKGMAYGQHQKLAVFDVQVNGQPLNKLNAIARCAAAELPFVPVIGVFHTLDCALLVNPHAESLCNDPDWKGHPANKEREGVVIEPVNPIFFADGERVYLKLKTTRFQEKSHNSFSKRPPVLLPQLIQDALIAAQPFINEPRYASVCSKIGEVTIKDIAVVTKKLEADVLQDMLMDEDVVLPESEADMALFNKELRKYIMPFVRPFLLANTDC